MAQKKTINLAVPEPLLEEFNEICAHYGHAKQKGLVLSAAVLMFLEADPADQGKALERIMIADVRSGVQSLIDRARAEQARRVEARHEAEHEGEANDDRSDDAQSQANLPRAAKKARQSRNPLKDLPDPPDPDQT